MTDRLQTPLKSHLIDPLDDDALERVRRRVAASRRVGEPSSSRRALAVGAALAAAGVLAVLGARLVLDPSAPDLRRADGQPLDAPLAPSAPDEIALSDGSVLHLGAGARVLPVRIDGRWAVLRQPTGRVTYDIHPGGPRRWRIESGSVRVEVLGTRFVVDRTPARVRVAVERGRVAVATDGIRRELTAGDVLELPSGASAPARAAATAAAAPRPSADVTSPPAEEASGDEALAGAPRVHASEAAEASTAGPDRGDTPRSTTAAAARAPGSRGDRAAPTRPARRAPPPWVLLARDHAYDEAFAHLGADGLRRASRGARSVDELFLLAATARLSGHPELAVDPLERLVRRHASAPEAAVAALTLGRLQLDALDRPRAAADSLETAARLGLPDHLAPVALARRVEAQRRAGRSDDARVLAAAYLERYPDGREAERLRAFLGD
ncbi:MAG: FecR domain-containing protein [Sandaracinaceae bacterium]